MVKILIMTDSMELRAMCIKHQYYTAGDNKAYLKMLNMFDDQHLDGDKLEILAKDIKEHSSTKDEVLDIVRNILDECCHFIPVNG